MGRLLLRAPFVSTDSDQQDLRVRYIERAPWLQTVPPTASLPASEPPPPATGGPAAATSPLVSRQQPARPASSAPLADRLYTSVGDVRVPPQSRIDPMKAPEIAANPPGQPNERELDRARKLLYPPNPIEVEQTRFGKDWASDGTLGDLAAQKMGNGMKKIAKAIFGEDIQSPTARPPPDVRFNPRLYEQTSDLGSERTGDAYKAAPITFQKAPGLEGEASRRIREQLEALLKRHAGCDRQRVERLAATVRGHLSELEQTEYASSHGADPVMARQMLPRRADSAYDQARRALWYANEQLASCAK